MLAHLSIRNRLFAAFGVLIVLLLAVAACRRARRRQRAQGWRR